MGFNGTNLVKYYGIMFHFVIVFVFSSASLESLAKLLHLILAPLLLHKLHLLHLLELPPAQLCVVHQQDQLAHRLQSVKLSTLIIFWCSGTVDLVLMMPVITAPRLLLVWMELIPNALAVRLVLSSKRHAVLCLEVSPVTIPSLPLLP